MLKSLAVLVAICGVVLYFYSDNTTPAIPTLPDVVWKQDGAPIEDEKIYPFSIETSPEFFKNLKDRLRNTTLYPPLNGVNFEYGFNTNHFKKIIDFWTDKYDWEVRKKRLNGVPHFRTKISGLRIHFIRVQPDPKKTKSKKVLPLLLLHGWPGSVKEFYAVFSRFTQPRPEYEFVFDVIAPSLPGYGFSEGAAIPGMNAAHVGLVMKKLMNRLGFEKFYVQGGDWGSVVGANMATLFPESVIGLHTNMCPSLPKSLTTIGKLILSSFYPSYFVENELFRRRIYPLSKHLSYILEETGYMHLQATKPDTIGVALTNSPAGLAAYILEKFSTWTNYNWRQRPDGGLNLDVDGGDKYTIEDLLDNVMIYWTTNSITTSMRLYSEQLSAKTFASGIDNIPTSVPTACANYPYDIMYSPEFMVREKFLNLVHFEHMPRGGHFAAFEEPELFANDVWKAICKIENVANSMNLKC